MASNITLSAGVRQNLLSLQNTAALMATTQNRLATGKKVNSALDNPTNFFTSTALQSRASDMSALLDGMSNGIKTLEAADNGLSAITKTVEQMQSTLRQARQDKSFATSSYTIDAAATGKLSISGGAVGDTAIDIDLTATVGADTVVKTVDQLIGAINSNADLKGKVRASNDNGKLRIENLSTNALTLTGAGSSGAIDGSTSEATIAGNDVRKNLVKQFNDLRDQLDKLSDDASINGVNLLRGDKLKITFNETGSSTMEIQAKTASGQATSINADELKITLASNADFDSDIGIDTKLDSLQSALNQLRSHASAFGSNLSIVQNRQDFTKAMINTLQTGADNLVLADSNEEGANLLALQTRQQLSTTALSLSAQADQAVLRLF